MAAVGVDSVLGSYELGGGSIPLSNESNFTFETKIFNTLGAAGASLGTGSTPTEFSVGYNHKFIDDTLSISGSLGVLNGAFMSSQNAGPARFADSLDPELKVDYSDSMIEASGTAMYFNALRQTAAYNSRNTLIYFLNFGFKIVPNRFSLGLTTEHYRFFTSNLGGIEAGDWYGGYMKFRMQNGMSLRFAAGVDLANPNVTGEFYKIGIVVPFII